jgi:hypothetical protein
MQFLEYKLILFNISRAFKEKTAYQAFCIYDAAHMGSEFQDDKIAVHGLVYAYAVRNDLDYDVRKPSNLDQSL